MVYKKKFIGAIKVDGKILRENGESVSIPFKSEYSIFMKNQDHRRAMVNIEIDGQNITIDGLIVNGNGQVDLERFIDTNRKFKFIKKSNEIKAYLGESSADSTIIIRYSFEKVKSFQEIFENVTKHYHSPRPIYDPHISPFDPNRVWYASNMTPMCSVSSPDIVYNDSISSGSAIINDVGMTVQGSKSNQTFNTVSQFETESEEYVMKFRLIGGKKITVKSKKLCPTCGNKWKSKYEYCPNDGTWLNK